MSFAEKKISEAEAAGDDQTADYWRHIKALVDEAPPFTEEEKAKLRVLLRPTCEVRRSRPVRPVQAAA